MEFQPTTSQCAGKQKKRIIFGSDQPFLVISVSSASEMIQLSELCFDLVIGGSFYAT